MSLSDRYTKVLLSSSPKNLAQARSQRLRLAAWRQKTQVRLADESTPDLSVQSTEEPSLSITPEARKQLGKLGYDDSDIQKMTPDAADAIVKDGTSKKQQEKAALRRERILDDREKKVLKELAALKKRLEYVKRTKDLLSGESLPEGAKEPVGGSITKLDEELGKILKARDDANDLGEQHRLTKKHDALAKRIHSVEKNLSLLESEIPTLEALIASITKNEEELITHLQEANEASVLIPGTADDKLIELVIKDMNKELDTIFGLRRSLHESQRELDEKQKLLLASHKELSAFMDQFGGTSAQRAKLNDFNEEIAAREEEVADLVEKQEDISRQIMRHEASLHSDQVQRRRQDMDNALKDLPSDADSVDKLKSQSDKDFAKEDLGLEIASKPTDIKVKADQMLAFTTKIADRYGKFITDVLSTSIPHDPKVHQFIQAANSVILMRSAEAKKLADVYVRNPKSRSATLLVPAMYEFLATTMNGVVDPSSVEDKDADNKEVESAKAAVKEAMSSFKEAHKLYQELTEAGMLREAMDIKQIGKSIADTIHKGKEIVDRLKFDRADTGPRRDPAADLKKNQLALSELRKVEHDLLLELQKAKEAHTLLVKIGDDEDAVQARNLIMDLQEKIRELGESKDVLTKGLQHSPSPGMMKGQEQAATRPKTDYEQATRLLKENKDQLTSFLRTSIPKHPQTEKELLRQSGHVADAARKMVKQGYKAKNVYPDLPATILAYGHMFTDIDDALNLALRSR